MANFIGDWDRLRRQWPGALVPYEIEQDVRDDVARFDAIMAGIRHWEDNTPVRFIERDDEEFWILFHFGPVGSGVCSAQLGRRNLDVQPQVINLSEDRFCSESSVIHEIGHALGFRHEHQRQDRDRFIRILMQNSGPGYANVVEKKGEPIGAYDFLSVMHYGSGQRDSQERWSFLEGFDDMTIGLAGGIVRCLTSRTDRSGITVYDISNEGDFVFEDQGQLSAPRQAVIDGSGWTQLSYSIVGGERVLIGINPSARRLAAWFINDEGIPGLNPDAEISLPHDDYSEFSIIRTPRNRITCLRRLTFQSLQLGQVIDVFRLTETAGTMTFDEIWADLRVEGGWDGVRAFRNPNWDILIDRPNRVVARADVDITTGGGIDAFDTSYTWTPPGGDDTEWDAVEIWRVDDETMHMISYDSSAGILTRYELFEDRSFIPVPPGEPPRVRDQANARVLNRRESVETGYTASELYRAGGDRYVMLSKGGAGKSREMAA